jgi:hypothetical protein
MGQMSCKNQRTKRKMYLAGIGRQAGASAESGVVLVFSMLHITWVYHSEREMVTPTGLIQLVDLGGMSCLR